MFLFLGIHSLNKLLSALRKPYLSKMLIYNALKFNMFFVWEQRKRLFRGDSLLKYEK